MELRMVPNEVKSKVGSGIFFTNYTHATGSCNREGIERTGKLLAPSLCMAEGIIPFSGENLPYTFLTRLYYLSVSSFLSSEHHWSRYIQYGTRVWRPEQSRGFIAEMEAEIRTLERMPMTLAHFTAPRIRENQILALQENIIFESERQRAYSRMGPQERRSLQNPEPDIYAFGPDIRTIRSIALGGVRHRPCEHPLVELQIKMRHLAGMFTSEDRVPLTKEWAGALAGRDIPVASVDALATWEAMLPSLPSFIESRRSAPQFQYDLLHTPDLRERVISEIRAL